jgi:protein TonB
VYVAPVYPQIALASRVQGTVILQAVIDEQGSVRELKVLRGHPLLDAAAMQAVAKWQFAPTLLNGTPVPVVMTVTVAFTLQK